MTSTTHDDLFCELERADRVIDVLMSHIGYLSKYDKERLEQDLQNRGLNDHKDTRRKVLAKAFDEHPQRDYLLERSSSLHWKLSE